MVMEVMYETILTFIFQILEVKAAKCNFALQKPCLKSAIQVVSGRNQSVDKKQWTTIVTKLPLNCRPHGKLPCRAWGIKVYNHSYNIKQLSNRYFKFSLWYSIWPLTGTLRCLCDVLYQKTSRIQWAHNWLGVSLALISEL